ncbi:MAG: FtsW/RodA/SpoVE family cell cycle protein [Blautia sp.]
MASKRKKKKQNVLQRFFSGIFPDRKSWSGEPYYDYNLLACVILLVSFGLVMLYSTSAYTAKVNYGSDMTFFAKQAGLSAACILGMLFISRVNYHWIANWGAWLLSHF